jgi:hypothetical protein
VRAILDEMPISYTLQITTANARVLQHTKAEEPPERDLTLVADGRGGAYGRSRAS